MFMIKYEIDQTGYVIGLSGLPLVKGNRQIEMSADQKLCLLSERVDKGYATRIGRWAYYGYKVGIFKTCLAC